MRHRPKRMPYGKHLHSMIFVDWPHAGPGFGRALREFVRIAKRRESRDAWKREGDVCVASIMAEERLRLRESA